MDLTTTLPGGQTPGYEAEGWTQPDHPEWSQQFARILGATQEGAGTVSECFLAASRMTGIGNGSVWPS